MVGCMALENAKNAAAINTGRTEKQNSRIRVAKVAAD
jgi:hypothetical protein